MTERTTYELTIADKLGQLSRPQLRDAIWARIAGELDADPPGPDDAPPAPPAPPAPNRPGGLRTGRSLPVLTAVVALIVFFTVRRQPARTPIPQKNLPAATQQTSSPPEPGAATPTVTLPQTRPVQAPEVATGTTPATTETEWPQSVPEQTAPALQQPSGDMPPAIPPSTAKDSLPIKKPRGFTGLRDEDYRISHQKDSAK